MDYLFNYLTTGDYYTIYLWLMSLFVFFGSLIIRHLASNKKEVYLRTDRNILIVFVTFIVLLFGTRGIKIGTDTWNYHLFYFLKGTRLDVNLIEFFEAFDTDFVFEVIMYLTFPFKNFTFFILTVSIILNVSMYKFVRKHTDYGNTGSSLLLFLMIASSFVFLSHQINTIRNGLAIPFILFGMHYMNLKKYKNSFIFLLIAFLCHKTALIPIACILGAHFSNKIKMKYFILFYLFGIGLALIGFGFNKIGFLASIGSEDMQRLSFEGETNYRIGFRLDFVLYNSIFLFLFLKLSTLRNKTDLFLIKYYILASVIFYLNFNIPFSDRIGVYSWIAIPLLFHSTIQNAFPKRMLHFSTIATLAYFTLNYIIIPMLSSSGSSENM